MYKIYLVLKILNILFLLLNDHISFQLYYSCLKIIKCNDLNCCDSWRSNLKHLVSMSNEFLLPSFPLSRTGDRLRVIPTPEDVKAKYSFCDLFFGQSVGLKPTTATCLPVSYNFYCPPLCNDIVGNI